MAEASNTIELATKKSRTIDRKLKNVSSLSPSDDQTEVLTFENEVENEYTEDDDE